MYFIVTHFTKNLWTTDYFTEYLRKNKISYIFLKHPFQSENDLLYSEVIEFDGKDEKIIWKYKKSQNFFFEMLRNFFLTFYISIKFFWKYKKVIGFGWFNIFPVLWVRIFWKITYFWWVDYSRKRFWNLVLNKIYLFLETAWCIFASKVISSSKRQSEAREKFHHAKYEKTIIINNGISNINFSKNFFQNSDICFFYLGSITPQHGVLDFIKYFYLENNISNSIYIIGWWELEEELKKIIEKNKLQEKIYFLWRKNREEILQFLKKNENKIFWIAPYSDNLNDHVYYGDSLKIREYLGYNIPFLVSDIPYISDDLQKFGITYKKFEEIDFEELKTFSFDIDAKNKILEKYTWDNLFSKEF